MPIIAAILMPVSSISVVVFCVVASNYLSKRRKSEIMSVIFVLIGVSVLVALGFLFAFLWAVKTGQYDDKYTPSVRMLFDDEKKDETKK